MPRRAVTKWRLCESRFQAFGRSRADRLEKQAGQQAKQQTEAASAQQTETFKKAMSACLEGRGYTVK